MLKRMVIDEQDADRGKLWLLRGCPRRWYAQGKSVVVKDAPTPFGKMALETASTGDTITVDINCPDSESVREIGLVARHPNRKAIAGATVNGRAVSVSGETLTIPAPQGHLHVVFTYR